MLKAGQGTMSRTDSRNRMSPNLPIDPQWPDAPPSPLMLTDSVTDKAFSSDTLDDLDRRHAKLLQDIEGISERLTEVAFRVSGN